MTLARQLASSQQPLAAVYDLVMLDLDGVVYVGSDPITGAAGALLEAATFGPAIAYVTNNASRTVEDVASRLRSFGLTDVTANDVVTSAQAVAHLVADALPPGAPVLLIGGEGLRGPLQDRGLRCVASADDGPLAVVQGFHPDLGWHELAEAAYAVGAGVPWYASNTDLSVPTPRGIAPGNGALVHAVAKATGRVPIVAGKPEPALFHETLERVGGNRPLMVGDRLDTDIDGAIGVGIDSLVVLTGVSDLNAIAAAPAGHRPSYVATDLTGLLCAHPSVVIEAESGTATCGSAKAAHNDGVVRLATRGSSTVEALRAMVALAWKINDSLSGSTVSLHLDGTLGL